ncbi:late sexual development protein [Ophiostoma piceae UAMH 11346]|uniref:Late sexual development protein n=1 Tax=Ophiostoma piceae (strain UAMH 11346) TaxID=1262450 RepID=S3CBD8_OPHP1|nr:late sexual development protein [Ophiostoma piceae UAMH 11346]
MFYKNIVASAALLTGVLAAPTPSALPQGFPNPNTTELEAIQKAAGGELSNAPPPASVNASSVPVFQLINFNENFEVAFFNSLVYNITNDVPGFQIPWGGEKASLLNILTSVLAQEELHALNAGGVLTHFNAFAPPPCVYKFPTTDLASAIALSQTFTSLVLGTLQDAAEGLAINGDHGPVRTVASVIGEEGEQNGFFRSLLNRKPAEKPFLTTSVATFLFSSLQDFVVSCPFDLNQIPIPRLPTIKVLSGNSGSDVQPQDQTLTFSVDLTGVEAAKPYYGSPEAANALFITYLTGQNLPVSKPINSIAWSGEVMTFQADFPFEEFTMSGLTVAALTTANNYTGPDDIAASTLAAPALIQVNDPIL